MPPLSLSFSPCPNDTFIFHALVHGLVDLEGLDFEVRLDDVETLNRAAMQGEPDVSKVSFGALPYLLGSYALLRSGGALGRGCGPLVVAREPLSPDRLRRATVAIPGRYTTANLLLRLHDPGIAPGIEMPYDRIMAAVAEGIVDAGLIIHESRFTFPEHGLVQIVDLGQWWETVTEAPIPLGAIVARRDLGEMTIARLERSIRRSVEFALRHPGTSATYVSRHARELIPTVIDSHIDLYVNRFSVDLGPDGERAVVELMDRAGRAGLLAIDGGEPFHPLEHYLR